MHGGFITFNQWIQRQRRNEQHGVGALFAIEYQMRIVGQISLGAIPTDPCAPVWLAIGLTSVTPVMVLPPWPWLCSPTGH
mgnify:CR=1 FL=1